MKTDKYDIAYKNYLDAGGPEFDSGDIDNMVIDYVFNSAAIEGNTFTYDETYSFLTSGQVIPGRSYNEHAELSDLKRAFFIMNEFAKSNTPLSEAMVMALHKELLRSTFPDHAGKYKATSNRVGKYSTPYPEKAKELFPKAINSFNQSESKKEHPLIIGAKIHFDTVLIHPFHDGNGRVARLLLDYALIKHDHPHFINKVSNRKLYIDAIVESREKKKYDPFISYVIDQATQSLEKKIEYLKKKPKNQSGSQKTSEGSFDFFSDYPTDKIDF